MSTNLSTVIPDWPQLNFSRNCSSYGQWLAAFIAPNPWTPEEALGGSIPLSIILLSHALPPGWTFNDSSAPNGTGGQNWLTTADSPAGSAYFKDAMQWFVGNLYYSYNATDGAWYANSKFVDNVIWNPADRCGREFCKAIAFTGNADLSGIGIVLSYYMEASLTSLYLIIFTGWRLWRYVKRRKQGDGPAPRKPRGRFSRGCHRAFDALRGTFDNFFTAATVLALAILIAVIVMETTHIHEHHRNPVNEQNIPSGHALYDSALGLLVGMYAVFPVIVLYSVLPDNSEFTDHPPRHPRVDHEHALGAPAPTTVLVSTAHTAHAPRKPERRGRRTWLRRGVLIVLWALVATVVFLDPSSELDDDYQGVIPPDDGQGSSSFAVALYACDQRGGLSYWRVLKSLPYLVIGVPVVWMLLTGLVYAVTSKSVWDRKLAKDRSGSQAAGEARSESRSDATSNEKRAEGDETLRGESEAPPKSAFLRLCRPIWRHLVAWVAAAVMWTILLLLTELRQNIIIVADGLDNENDWEFGQVLAIATWGPPLVDFLFLLSFGIEDGLAGRLPLDFTIRHVVSTSDVDESSEDGDDNDRAEPNGGLANNASPTQTRASVSGSSPASGINSVVSRTSTSHNNRHDESVDYSKAAIVHESNRDSSTSSPSRLRTQPSSSSSPAAGPQATTQAAP